MIPQLPRAVVSLTALLCALSGSNVWAQAQPRALDQTFQRLDKNGDGKLTRAESPNPESFDAADADKDGVVTLEEFRRYFATRQAAAGKKQPAATASAPPATPSPEPASPSALFRRAEIAGLTDTPIAVNGFAIADLNRDGLPDIIATRQLRTTFSARPGQELPHDRLDVLINRGGMKFEPHVIQITGSDLTPGKFGASAEVPNLADFNGDGFLDIFITRSGGEKQQPHGNTLLLSDGAWDKFRDVSAAMGVQNRDGYNRQSSIADVNGDGWLDIAIGCDTIGRPDRYGTPHSRFFVFQPKGAKFVDGRFGDIAGTRGLEDFGGYTGDPTKDKAGPSISLRDLDNDGDLDLVQTYHADMTGASQNDHEAAGNYAQGVWVWKNLLHVNPESAFPYDMEEITNGNFQRKNLADYARYAEAFFKAEGKPFFLQVSYPDAHDPFLTQVDGLPKQPLTGKDVNSLPYFGINPPELRQIMADYYNCMSRLDTLVGDLLAALERSGKADNTLVIYLGDHGPDLLRGKRSSYEGGTHIPLLVRWPGKAQPQVRTEFISTTDFMPTLLSVSGAAPVPGLPGQSLVPLLAGEKPAWRDHLFTEFHTHAARANFFPQRAVRGDRYQLIENLLPDEANPDMEKIDKEFPFVAAALAAAAPEVRSAYQLQQKPPRYELYDLQTDPYEFRNLTGSAEHAAVFADLKQRLLTWREETQDPLLNPTNLTRLKAEVYSVKKKADGKQLAWGYPDYFFGKEPATATVEPTKKKKKKKQ